MSRVFEPATFAAATHIATVCEYAAHRPFVARHHAKFVGVVPNGVVVPPRRDSSDRDAVRHELGIRRGDLTLVCVGRLSSEKGLQTLAQSLALAPMHQDGSTSTHVIIAGEGPAQKTLEQAFGGIEGVSPHFIGLRRDVPRILAASDVFVFPLCTRISRTPCWKQWLQGFQ